MPKFNSEVSPNAQARRAPYYKVVKIQQPSASDVTATTTTTSSGSSSDIVVEEEEERGVDMGTLEGLGSALLNCTLTREQCEDMVLEQGVENLHYKGVALGHSGLLEDLHNERIADYRERWEKHRGLCNVCQCALGRDQEECDWLEEFGEMSKYYVYYNAKTRRLRWAYPNNPLDQSKHTICLVNPN